MITALAGSISRRADDLFSAYQHDIHRRTDRLFAGLMAFQWVLGIAFALWVSPLTWAGAQSTTHLHVWAAVLLGGVISIFPALLGLFRPGFASTRYIIAVAQMLMGALLIHLTGGRIETHFHVFGSLAFLAFYRDWRVLVPATIVVALDHMLRGIFWPQSVYGVMVSSEWRWLEHAAWVAFEDLFLVVACLRSVAEIRQTAERTAALEHEVRTRQDAEDEARKATATLSELVAQLKITQRQAEIATRAKSEFLASMSHELRTPLNAIILYSELLQEEAKGTNAGGSIADLQRIQFSGKHLLDLINGILDLSKIEAGKMGLELGGFGVKAMIDELSDSVASLVQKNHNVLTVRCNPNVGMMHADLTKTRQILLNLLSNAAKFTTEGSIAVDARRITHRGLDQIEFSVTDTGVGMTEHQCRIVFEPFTQADVTTTRKYGGTGLGLAIVSRFCELMGGTIAVESRLGHGSTFVVRLPADMANAVRVRHPMEAA
jgi:two-component system, sensor histidine kinase and response regulator